MRIMVIHKHIVSAPFFMLLIALCIGGRLTAQNAVTVQIKNEDAVNSKGLDFSPTFYEDGIVFISTNNAGLKKTTDEKLKLPAMSILHSRRDTSGILATPEPFAKELSSIYHEGPVCFDRTAETVYFSRNVLVGKKVKVAKDGVQKMRLYMAKKNGSAWSEPIALPFNTNEFDDCHPAISIDGDKLFFSSNRPGGFGGMDLYVSYKVGETWSEPVNLGSVINTKGNEVFPFVHADNTIYYASDATDGGKGGLDIWCSSPEGTSWAKPKNMGLPFNSPGDDFGLIVDLNKINGYFSSNGNGGKGGDEIFSFHVENGNLDDFLLQKGDLPKRKLDIRVIVTDKNNGNPIEDADVHIVSAEVGNVIGRDENGNLITVQNIDGQDVMKPMPTDEGISGYTNERGRFVSEITSGNYLFIVSREGYQTKQLRLPITKAGNELKVQLEKVLVAGKVRWTGSVFNQVTNTPLAGTTLVMTNKTTGAKDTIITDANGMVDYYLEPNSKYNVNLYQGGRMIGTTSFETGPGPTQNTNLSIAPLMPGTVIELPNIYYNFNDATLRPDARKDLDMVIALMAQQPGIAIELSSHTDCRGSSYYNQELSQRRANGVAEYLYAHGVSRDRLKPVGYGESEPRNNCEDGVPCTDQQHARNRRTEIKIVTGIQGSSVIFVDGQLKENTDQAPQHAGATGTPGKKVNTAPAPTGKIEVTTVESNMFYVIAGSFLMENRAQNRLVELKSLGYSNAEIIQFPNSTFYSVCAGKTESRKEAEQLEHKIEKTDKLEAFVRRAP